LLLQLADNTPAACVKTMVAVAPQPPTMKLGVRDVVRVEQSRLQKAEMQALRQQVEEMEKKQVVDRALVEQVPGAMEAVMAELATLRTQVPDAMAELAVLRNQVPDAMVELAALRNAVVEAEKNKMELTAEMEKNKQEYASEIAGLKEAQKSLDAAFKARPVAAPAVTVPKPITPAKSTSFEDSRRVSSSSSNGRLSASGTYVQAPKPVVEEESKGLWGGLVSYFKPKEEVPKEEVADFDGCYLLFTEASGGAFITHWSETELPEGSVPLAYYKPDIPVAKHKYSTKGGLAELCRGVGGPNKKLFYQGWASFLRAAYGQNGTLTFLSNVGACPVAIFLCHADTSVLRLQMGSPIKLTSEIVAVAVTPPLATGLDVLKMPTRMFQAVGEKAGAAFSLDGGGDGQSEDVAAAKAKSLSRRATGDVTPRDLH